MVRKQFTFYASFLEAILRIRDDADQAAAFRMICSYALYGKVPDADKISDGAAILFAVVKPVLEASRRKAKSGSIGGSSKQNASKNKDKAKDKVKDKDKNKINIKDNSPDMCPGAAESDFEIFWSAYPKKVGKEATREAFGLVDEPLENLLAAVDRQRRSNQWAKDGGQFVPNPARWLENRGWEDQLPTGTGKGKQPSGRLGQAELENIRRLMEEG